MLLIYTGCLLFLLFLARGMALECVTGYSIFPGKPIAAETEKCASDSDSCYNISAVIAGSNDLKVAGCTSYKCVFNKNLCIGQSLFGHQVKLCCCDYTDLCNSKYTNMTFFEATKAKISDFINAFGKKR